MKKTGTWIVAIFAVFIVHLTDGTQITGDKISVNRNNGVFVYELNKDKASLETYKLKAFVPNAKVKSVEVK